MDTKDKNPIIRQVTNKEYPSELPSIMKFILNNTMWDEEVALGFNGIYMDDKNRQYDIFFHGCEGWIIDNMSYITKYRIVIVGLDKDNYYDVSEFDRKMNPALHTIMQHLYDCHDTGQFPIIIKDSLNKIAFPGGVKK